MAKRKVQSTKKVRKVKKTKAQRKTLDEIHYGPEPDVDYFENKTLNDYLNWYNYMWDRKQSIQMLVIFAKKFGYKNANKFKKMMLPLSLAYIAHGLERGLTFPTPKKAKEGEAGNTYYHRFLHEELSI